MPLLRGRPPKKPAQRECEAWNARHPIGTMVRYWRGTRDGEPSGTGPTTFAACVLGGVAVLWVRGLSGCVALSHVEPIEKRQLELGGLQ